MESDKNVRLTPEIAGQIDNWGESIFAKAVSQKDHLVVDYQVTVGERVIDFKVTNTRSNTTGKLVEVTSTPDKKIRKKQRKNRQRNAMKDSGLPHTILGGDSLNRLQSNNNDDF